jgi:hypothetical protein
MSKHVTHHRKERDDEETPKEATAATETAERRPATEPWDAQNAPDSPRKKGLLGISKSKKGHEVRWVRYDLVDRRKNQGYKLATPEDFDATPDENGMIRRNELVLMVVPTEVYEQRRQEIANFTKQQSEAPRQEYLRERAAASRQAGEDLSTHDRDDE